MGRVLLNVGYIDVLDTKLKHYFGSTKFELVENEKIIGFKSGTRGSKPGRHFDF
jgi:hypothetical protein